ncbi:hypothetical protein BDP55DRAFT_687693 [Colletotrichum godetiae]|uniref:Uncharacterized protein n=1 Tax=Colletotrichum godetiae TaxID=1209918 RepID=A0AAJ0EPV8_9PEZI|nr:uncharacterized protein BDP55DRAFT_687693 [Colletotrichum godetiae]KAK1656868.1 hypothetical protein BDP55DRAFT_687693 [Colletotrichum godetiae]
MRFPKSTSKLAVIGNDIVSQLRFRYLSVSPRFQEHLRSLSEPRVLACDNFPPPRR